MKHLAAYLLLGIGGNAHPTAHDIKKVLGSVGLEAEEDRLTLLLDKLEGKSIEELISQGMNSLVSLQGTSTVNVVTETKTVSKEEEPAKQEEQEESDEDMGFGLFD
ncbi:hypothetical protein PCANB_000086 [Pneumocystis canis]|nr:hypothetical protein PCANB_000086 [Pneumocystis canis]